MGGMSTRDNADTNRALKHQLFLQREYATAHLPYDAEMHFYEAVKQGDRERVQELMRPLSDSALGRLSANPLANLKYHLIITIAMLTRFCIEGGLESEAAYTMSDVYIRKLDLLRDGEEVKRLHRRVIEDFTGKMHEQKREPGISRTIIRAMDYVYDHLHEKILLDKLAEHVGVNPTWLCTLFKRETGHTIGGYIAAKRMEAAREMLAYSDHSPANIGSCLAWSSYSHFIASFKKANGLTPSAYRKSRMRAHFSRQRGTDSGEREPSGSPTEHRP